MRPRNQALLVPVNGRKLLFYRQKACLTQKEAAQRAKVSEKTYWTAETRGGPIRANKLRRIAQAVGLGARWEVLTKADDSLLSPGTPSAGLPVHHRRTVVYPGTTDDEVALASFSSEFEGAAL